MRRFLEYNRTLVPRAQQLRRAMTPAERKLWYGFLRHHRPRVLRQRPIDQFIVDFYCATFKLVIEVDGAHHDTPQGRAYDLERTRRLEGHGLRVVRFSNRQVMREFEAVCQELTGLLGGGGDPPGG